MRLDLRVQVEVQRESFPLPTYSPLLIRWAEGKALTLSEEKKGRLAKSDITWIRLKIEVENIVGERSNEKKANKNRLILSISTLIV